MVGLRNGSDTWSKPSGLRGRGVAQNIGLGRCAKLLQTVIQGKPADKESKRAALLKVEHPKRGSSM